MTKTFAISLPLVVGSIAAIAPLFVQSADTFAEERLTEPVYRVANETTAAQPAATTAAPTGATSATLVGPAAQAAGQIKFDMTRKPDEHELAPVLRALKFSQEQIDRNIRDYSCTLVKRERVDGELGDYQHIFMKVMHQPFSVYMSFVKPYTGREVVYVTGQNEGKMVVLEAGFTRVLGKMNLDPNGTRAMSGQRHPITDVGMRNLIAKLEKMWEAESQFRESEVTTKAHTDANPCKINGRPTLMVQVKHPIPRQNFKYHATRLFFDNELGVPIHFDAYSWPAQPGAEAPLEESYTYTNLKVNNGFTARDFDSNNNPEIFKK